VFYDLLSGCCCLIINSNCFMTFLVFTLGVTWSSTWHCSAKQLRASQMEISWTGLSEANSSGNFFLHRLEFYLANSQLEKLVNLYYHWSSVIADFMCQSANECWDLKWWMLCGSRMDGWDVFRHWQAFFSSVIPGELMRGYMAQFPSFPSWLGRRSAAGRQERLLQELTMHTCLG